jgi:hypothetical protein
VDLDHARVSVVADGTARIDADMVETQNAPGVAAGDKVAQCNAGKFYVRIPSEGFSRTIRADQRNRVGSGGVWCHFVHGISNFIETLSAGQ